MVLIYRLAVECKRLDAGVSLRRLPGSTRARGPRAQKEAAQPSATTGRTRAFCGCGCNIALKTHVTRAITVIHLRPARLRPSLPSRGSTGSSAHARESVSRNPNEAVSPASSRSPERDRAKLAADTGVGDAAVTSETDVAGQKNHGCARSTQRGVQQRS